MARKKITTGNPENLLRKIITRRNLADLAGKRSFARGVEYFRSGCVIDVVEYGGLISAVVEGTSTYHVKFWMKPDGVGWSCTCPYAREDNFCKHCVATGLSWLEQQKRNQTTSGKSQKINLMEDIHKYFTSLTNEQLIEVVMQQAMEDADFRRRLYMKVATCKPEGLDISTYQEAIDLAVNPSGHADYYDDFEILRDVDDVVKSLQEHLDEGHSKEIIELSEYALARIEESMGMVDDSDGYYGDLLDCLQDIHFQACKKEKPDPKDLAERLFEWEMTTEFDTFYLAVQNYADILGEKGLAVYRKLAKDKWDRVSNEKDAGYKEFRIKAIMESLARIDDNIEELVAIKKRDISYPYHYLEIAEIYKEAGDNDLALEWAEKGMKTFPDRRDSRLTEFLANQYHSRKRHDEAIELIWNDFTANPSIEKYRRLKDHAKRGRCWAKLRSKALDFCRKVLAKDGKRTRDVRPAWDCREGYSLLVQVFLYEKDVNAAWREACEGGCSNDLWLELAALREKKHPDDALPIYQKQIEPVLSRKNNQAYADVVNYLKKIRKLMFKLNKQDEFKTYLESVSHKHKRKRNFMKLLDGEKW